MASQRVSQPPCIPTMLSIMDQIITGYRQYYATQYVHLSSVTFLLCDYVATLPDEIELFWTGKWSFARVLFLVNRYQALAWQLVHTIGVLMPSRSDRLCVILNLFIEGCQLIKVVSGTKSCQIWIHDIMTFSLLALVIDVQLILSIRVYGLYGRANWIAGLLAVLFLAATAGELYIVIKLSLNAVSVPLPFSNITICESTLDVVFRLYLGLIPAIAFDTLNLLLVLLRGIMYLRSQKKIGFRGSNFVRLLMRDSVLYFLIILVVYIALAGAWIELPGVETFITFGYGFSIISVTASHMLINLKKH